MSQIIKFGRPVKVTPRKMRRILDGLWHGDSIAEISMLTGIPGDIVIGAIQTKLRNNQKERRRFIQRVRKPVKKYGERVSETWPIEKRISDAHMAFLYGSDRYEDCDVLEKNEPFPVPSAEQMRRSIDSCRFGGNAALMTMEGV